ncbi:hypothetical protein AAFC00_006914 [Neodothiora populina]|uniref:Ribosome biogenesis protein NOP53 n=1 Tax=Neodothiora populina TaxID=2781224 RepID=A0ABR3PBQ7_9PEZI
MSDPVAVVQRAPSQFKQPSRKGKKAWRKNVDITEVNSGLEDIRDEIIQGGVLAERPAEQLFTLDLAGQDAVKNEYRNKHKPLKSEEIIAQRSAIPAVDSRKRKSAAADGVATGSSKRSKNGAYVPYHELQRLKAIAASGTTAADQDSAPKSASYDPWAVEPESQSPPALPFLEPKKAPKLPQTLQHPPISLAANGKPFPSVGKPQAGKSYNPAFEDWDALVSREAQKEFEAEQKRVQKAKEDEERMEKALAEAAKPEPKGVDDDDYESAWESEWDGIQSESEQASYLDKKRPGRKTPQERNKMRRRKEAEARAKWEKQMRKKEEQQKAIKSLTRQVERKERERLQRLAAPAQDDESSDDEREETLRKKSFGKNPIPQAPLEVVLADELQDSLRALRPEGNLLGDRFRKLMVNGKIEARKPVFQYKKPKREVTEKWSYKDWKLR